MAATLDRWKCLPTVLLRSVIRRVPCEADRASVALVCRNWRAALATPPGEAPLLLPPQLPWLLRPLPGGPAFSCLFCSDGVSSTIHRFRLPDDARTARYFGSYDGRWAFAASRLADDAPMLLNLRTGERYSVPREFLPGIFRSSEPGASGAMTMLVATLSSAPDADGDPCVGAAIVRSAPFDGRSGHLQITFWRMGHQYAMPPYDLMMGGEPVDVVYHDGAFQFLTEDEHLYVCRPVFGQGGVLQAVEKGLRVVQKHWCRCRAYDQQPHVRYLVESRGELLMVVKASPASNEQRSPMWTFMVFRMTQIQTSNPYHMIYTWNMVPSLNGRILFVGLGCSRAYEVADFPGFKEGIYFLDDRDTRMNHTEPYPCSDNGKWSRVPPFVNHCFPPHQGESNYSSPVWVLP
ncbi:hypothetical protein HU200_024619 [Digitaria exilis]|uniref:DUF295 domain-containing protein n=1 Tax=Digitaria exilis TaxID=1010633 RepID=A0A835CAV3_9POAL|nr:hypothetical protein HU200_024619 [Digitaria exilis]